MSRPRFRTPPGRPGAGQCAPDPEVASDISEDLGTEKAISRVLRAGVLSSLAIVLAGVVVMFVQHPDYRAMTGPVHFHVLVSHREDFPHSVSGMVSSVAAGRGSGIVYVGLFVLLLTPLTMVVSALANFVAARDRKMAWVASVVLVVLVGSLFLGGAA